MKVIKRNNGSDIKIFATTVEGDALKQIKKFGEFDAYKDSKIRIMPDCHAGYNCTIGTTIEIKDKVTPNLVGGDIGCGMLTVKLKETKIDLKKLDDVINAFIPNGFDTNSKPKADFEFDKLVAKNLNLNVAILSIGSLGGGNHFIEVDKNSKNELFLVIHSGSRNFGGQVAKYYQKIAEHKLTNNLDARTELIQQLKKEGRQKEISEQLKKLKPIIDKNTKSLAYLTGTDFDNYMHDLKLTQEYAVLNRRTMADIILNKTGLTEVNSFETIHNYIDFDRMVLRKGAVSAEKGKMLLIPINMRDGSIIAVGKGNADWNYSAPHGAGRVMSRNEAKKRLDLDDFKDKMKNVYSTSVTLETLDESPDAYKSMDEIVEAIKDTVDIVDIVKPIYNFKAHSIRKDIFKKKESSPEFNLFKEAIDKNNVETINFLIEDGHDIDVRDGNGDSVLMYAIKESKVKITKCFINNGVDINAQNNQGNTALNYSIRQSNIKFAKLLIKSGVDVTIRNNAKETAFDLATNNPFFKKNTEVMSSLDFEKKQQKQSLQNNGKGENKNINKKTNINKKHSNNIGF